MLVTARICTLNRAESLRRKLESVAAMRLPDELEREVVVSGARRSVAALPLPSMDFSGKGLGETPARLVDDAESIRYWRSQQGLKLLDPVTACLVVP